MSFLRVVDRVAPRACVAVAALYPRGLDDERSDPEHARNCRAL
jgi:hypothetical protein